MTRPKQVKETALCTLPAQSEPTHAAVNRRLANGSKGFCTRALSAGRVGPVFFLTNLSRGTHGPLKVGEVYRCRWEIEVDNAVEKEGARLDEITATKGVSIRILLLASMLNATIARTIVQSEKVDIGRGKAPSEPSDRAPLHAILLLKALASAYSSITRLLFDPDASRMGVQGAGSERLRYRQGAGPGRRRGQHRLGHGARLGALHEPEQGPHGQTEPSGAGGDGRRSRRG